MKYEIKARCKAVRDNKVCDRFLKLKASASSEVVVTCPDRKCKADNTIKVVMLSDHIKNGH